MTTVRLLTWNQGDVGESPATGWDVACLQERSPHQPPKWAERFTSRALKGLAIDWNPDVFEVHKKGAPIAHIGLAKVTPTRGTLYVLGITHVSNTGDTIPLAVICSHRLNDPDGDTRAYGPIRRLIWNVHARLDARLARRFERQGYVVLFGGDINDREAGLAPLVRQLRGHYDALGYTRSKRVHLTNLSSIGRRGSDHGGYIGTFDIKGKP